MVARQEGEEGVVGRGRGMDGRGKERRVKEIPHFYHTSTTPLPHPTTLLPHLYHTLPHFYHTSTTPLPHPTTLLPYLPFPSHFFIRLLVVFYRLISYQTSSKVLCIMHDYRTNARVLKKSNKKSLCSVRQADKQCHFHCCEPTPKYHIW